MKMECPRCGDSLEEYSLATEDAEEFVCKECGYAGVPVEHGSEPEETETWEEAFERFSQKENDDE